MSDFVTLIPNIKSSIITVPPEDTPMSGTFVANEPTKEKEKERISIGSQHSVINNLSCIVVSLYNVYDVYPCTKAI